MTLLADLLATVFERRTRLGAAARDEGRPFEALAGDLIGAAGEVSGQALAHQILSRYEGWGDDEKLAFFTFLARDMAIDPGALRAALAAYEEGQTKESYRAFLAAAEAPRQELIRRLNQLPGATRTLVNMRADLLRLARRGGGETGGETGKEAGSETGKEADSETGADSGALLALDLDFRHLFASWFNRGFLVLRPINWQSPAHILEKIIAYEAVHAIDSWDDLRRRLAPADRRCFAFFHPAMPDEPLIFVEVALSRGVPGSIQALLAEDRAPGAPDEADTAVFYSISNCQVGLAGISFGNSLIKQVAADLAAEWPALNTFVTLSPMPGFAKWRAGLDGGLDGEGANLPLRALGAAYLARAKRADGAPLDPVARFHLGNGALIHQIHEGADTSPKGAAQSAGLMVNYLYDLAKVSANHERFATTNDIAQSNEIRALAAEGAQALPKDATP